MNDSIRASAQQRLLMVAELLATGLLRTRCKNSASAHRPVDLDNASEERVTVRALKPPRRDRRDVH